MTVGPDSRVPIGGRWALWPVAGFRTAGLPFCALEVLTDSSASRPVLLPTLARNEAFASALTWQNAAVANNWLMGYRAQLRGGNDHLNRRSQREVLLASYLQRYCAKNDTIGFFGPVGWARIDPGADGHVQALPVEAAVRSAHVEPWVVRQFLDRLSTDPATQPFLPLRRSPAADGQEQTLLQPPGRTRRLDPAQWSVWQALGNAPVSRIELVRDCTTETHVSVQNANRAIDELLSWGALLAGPAVPMDGHPERILSQLVQGGPAADALNEPVCAFQKRVADAQQRALSAATPEAVLEAVHAAQEMVQEFTGAPGQHSKPERQIGRSPLYIDEGAGVRAIVGHAGLNALSDPLSVVLDVADWLAREVGEAVLEAAVDAFAALSSRDTRVRLDALLAALAPTLSGGPQSPVHAIMEDLRARWAIVFGRPQDAAAIVDVSTAAALAQQVFPSRSALWSGARQHSPDVLLAETASGPLWVLGELHIAVNTLENGVFYRAHPPAGFDLDELTAVDLPRGRVRTCFSSSQPGVTARTWPPLSSDLGDGEHHWAVAADAVLPRTPVPVAASPAMHVVSEPTGLVVRAESAGWCAPLLEVLGDLLSTLSVNLFRPFGDEVHQGRVQVGGLVLGRETWRFTPGALQAAGALKDGAALRAWLVGIGAPRHLFATAPGEAKPVYVDLDASPLTTMLTRILRRAAEGVPDGRVAVSEMLPAPEHLWFNSSTGAVTAELRLAAGQRDTHAAPWWGLA